MLPLYKEHINPLYSGEQCQQPVNLITYCVLRRSGEDEEEEVEKVGAFEFFIFKLLGAKAAHSDMLFLLDESPVVVCFCSDNTAHHMRTHTWGQETSAQLLNS